MLVLDREPAHRAEAGEDQRVHARLGAAREDRIRVAALDQLGALSHRVRAGRARRDDRVVRAADPERDGDLAARGVDEDVRQEERRHAVQAALAQEDRKSTRLNSSHVKISYAVFCLKKKKKKQTNKKTIKKTNQKQK